MRERGGIMRRVIMLVVLLGFVLVGCPPGDDAGDPSNLAMVSTDSGIVDYGNGLYYFNCDESTFGNKLSMFLRERSELELVSISSDNTDSQGTTTGYFVYFREKEVCTCECVVQEECPSTESSDAPFSTRYGLR